MWPEGKMTGSAMMSSDIGHLKSLGTAAASFSIVLLPSLPLFDWQQQQWALFLLLLLIRIGNKKKKKKSSMKEQIFFFFFGEG